MDQLDRPALATAAGETLRRYHYWTGRSGRDYVHGIYEPGELPHYRAAAVVMVVRNGSLRRAVDVAATGAAPDLFFRGRRYASAIRHGVNELHLHLAEDAAGAARAAADLAGAAAMAPEAGSRPVERGLA